MRILFLSNFYPPFAIGGYEQWCHEVAEGLKSRGHEVNVLTTRHWTGRLKIPEQACVHRTLNLEMELASLRNGLQFFTSRKAREKESLDQLRQLIANLDPDVVLVWGMWNLPRSLAALAETLRPGRVVYYMGDYWPTLPSQFEFYWQAPARNWATAIPKSVLKLAAHRMLSAEKPPTLEFAHVLFPTAFMRNELKRKGICFRKAQVICGAIDSSLYSCRKCRVTTQSEGLSLLSVGRLTPDKGVHTAIEALGELVHQRGLHQVKLTIVGDGEPDYESHLRWLARQKKVESLVTFLGAQPKEAMPEIYQQADILLFTSIWPEPFGRVLVESMAAGVVVVGTTTGGAAEILTENQNALTFSPGDATSLATQVKRLVESPSLMQQLAESGRHAALEKFDIQRMTSEIEKYLQSIVDEHPRSSVSRVGFSQSVS